MVDLFIKAKRAFSTATSDSGVSLVELMFALALVIGGGVMFWSIISPMNKARARSDAIRAANNEIDRFLVSFKQKYGSRVRPADATTGLPGAYTAAASGITILRSDGTPCPAGTSCPQVKLLLRDTNAAGGSANVFVTTACKDKEAKFDKFDYSGAGLCISCPKDSPPIVTIDSSQLSKNAGVDSRVVELPGGLSGDEKTSDSIHSLAVCFSWSGNVDVPFSISLEASTLDASKKVGKLIYTRKTVGLPINNLSGIGTYVQ